MSPIRKILACGITATLMTLAPLATSSVASATEPPPDGLVVQSRQSDGKPQDQTAHNDSSAAAEEKVFNTRGDYVHISGSAPRTASGHGWWENISSDATQADVTVQLQVLNSGNWINVGTAGKKRVKAGGGSANRANGRYTCRNTLNVYWRSVIDVDLVGYPDSPEKLPTPSRLLSCGA